MLLYGRDLSSRILLPYLALNSHRAPALADQDVLKLILPLSPPSSAELRPPPPVLSLSFALISYRGMHLISVILVGMICRSHASHRHTSLTGMHLVGTDLSQAHISQACILVLEAAVPKSPATFAYARHYS